MTTTPTTPSWTAQTWPVAAAMLAFGSTDSRGGPIQDADPEEWALRTLGFDARDTPDRSAVQRRFRTLLRAAHPDHGGDADRAATRIEELSEARRLLLVPAIPASTPAR